MNSHTPALAAIALSLAACATQPRPGSLLDVQQQARQQTWESCIRTQFGVNRNVPLLALGKHCDRVVRLQEASARRAR